MSEPSDRFENYLPYQPDGLEDNTPNYNAVESSVPEPITELKLATESLIDLYKQQLREFAEKAEVDRNKSIAGAMAIQPTARSMSELLISRYRSVSKASNNDPDLLQSRTTPATRISESKQFPRFFIAAKPRLAEFEANNFVANRVKRKLARERTADSYRKERMTGGTMSGRIRDIVVAIPSASPTIRAYMRQAKNLRAGTQGSNERHRRMAPFGAALLGNIETRRPLMDAIDAATTEESNNLKAEAYATNGQLTADVVVIGTGVQAATFVARYRAEQPNARIICIDSAPKIGGQFRAYGSRAVFYNNSRNDRPQVNGTEALPGGSGNINSFGEYAPTQLTDYTCETYVKNTDKGDGAAVIIRQSAETLVDSTVVLADTADDGNSKFVVVMDNNTGNDLRVNAKQVINISGSGERVPLVVGELPANVLDAEEVFKHFGDETNVFPMQKFAGKRVLIAGGGDTGRVVAELFCRLAPPEAYGNSSVQLGGVGSLGWCGTGFANRDEFCDSNRPRYNRLASYIPEDADNPKDRDIGLQLSKLKAISKLDNGSVLVTYEDGTSDTYDYVVNAGPLTNYATSILTPGNGASLQFKTYFNILDGSAVPIAKRSANGIYFAGPAAELPLSAKQKASYNSGIRENTKAIWANTPPVELLARELATELVFAA